MRWKRWLVGVLVVACVGNVWYDVHQVQEQRLADANMLKQYLNDLEGSAGTLSSAVSEKPSTGQETLIETSYTALQLARQDSDHLIWQDPSYAEYPVYHAIPDELCQVFLNARRAPNPQERLKTASTVLKIYIKWLSNTTLTDPKQMALTYQNISTDLAQSGFTRGDENKEHNVPKDVQ